MVMTRDQIRALARELNLYVLDSNSGYVFAELDRKVRLHICEGISHSVHCWWRCDSGNLFICTLPFYHDRSTFERLRLFVDRVNPGLSTADFIILCNSMAELQAAREAGWSYACFCNQNAWLDERLYRISCSDEAKRCYDLVLNCRPERWKRPYLAAGIERLAVIRGAHFRKHDYFDLRELNPLWINEERLSLQGVVAVLNKAKTGGIFSAIEGACYSNSEFLLCGLPVISTHSLGGRDVFYNSFNSRIIEPRPDACQAALVELLEQLGLETGLRAAIRDAHLQLSSEHRLTGYQTIDRRLQELQVKPCAKMLLEAVYRNKMVRYRPIEDE